jgi:hypothetical protein
VFTREEIHEAGLDDFRVFLRQVWDFLLLPEPTPVQNDIAYHLQHGPRRMIIEAFRGVGKSWITVAFALWCLLLDPQMKIMIVSASQSLADDSAKFMRALIDGMPILHHLAPKMGQRDSAIKFDVGPARESKDPSVKSVGITGQITGSRADMIIADDIEVPKNSYTHLLRERLSSLVKEFDAVLKPGGRVIYLGTPQVEATLYNRLKKRGYEMFIWTAEIPKKIAQYGGRLAKYILGLIDKGAQPGDPVDAARFSREDLDERLASYGRSDYALQFLLDTSLSDAEKHPLKCMDMIVMDVHSSMAQVNIAWSKDKDCCIQDLECGGLDGDAFYKPMWVSDEVEPFQGTVMAIDPSGRGQDETAYAIVRYLYGMLFLVASGGFKKGYDTNTLQSLAEVCCNHRVNDIIIEVNYGGGMFDQLLRPVIIREAQSRKSEENPNGIPPARFVPQEEWSGWSTGQKELRICSVMEPVLTNHKLVVDRKVIERDLETQEDTTRYSLIQQLTRMERLKGALANEDRLEALSMACSYYTERMNRDAKKMQEKAQQKLLDAELRRFARGTLGTKGRSLNWGSKKDPGRFI